MIFSPDLCYSPFLHYFSLACHCFSFRPYFSRLHHSSFVFYAIIRHHFLSLIFMLSRHADYYCRRFIALWLRWYWCRLCCLRHFIFLLLHYFLFLLSPFFHIHHFLFHVYFSFHFLHIIFIPFSLLSFRYLFHISFFFLHMPSMIFFDISSDISLFCSHFFSSFFSLLFIFIHYFHFIYDYGHIPYFMPCFWFSSFHSLIIIPHFHCSSFFILHSHFSHCHWYSSFFHILLIITSLFLHFISLPLHFIIFLPHFHWSYLH